MSKFYYDEFQNVLENVCLWPDNSRRCDANPVGGVFSKKVSWERGWGNCCLVAGLDTGELWTVENVETNSNQSPCHAKTFHGLAPALKFRCIYMYHLTAPGKRRPYATQRPRMCKQLCETGSDQTAGARCNCTISCFPAPPPVYWIMTPRPRTHTYRLHASWDEIGTLVGISDQSFALHSHVPLKYSISVNAGRAYTYTTKLKSLV